MRTKNVYVVANNVDFQSMFETYGWELTADFNHADLIQFTGGEDVHPVLYGEPLHKLTWPNPQRDKREAVFYNMARKKRIPMAGVCRGGQFLNVMCGGWMWQHVDKHNLIGTHAVIDNMTGQVWEGTSTHHQMMRPAAHARVLAVSGESTFKESMDKNGHTNIKMFNPLSNQDPEVVFYPIERCLCFQPHPEYEGFYDLQKIYFDYIEDYLFEGQLKKEEAV